MSKMKKVVISVLIILSCTSFVFASSVNMNISNENLTTNENVTSSTNITNNTLSDANTNTSNFNNSLGANSSNSFANTSSNISANIDSVKNINDVGSTSMDITQILNIFLIAVGVILIFLAIAILIRMKK